MFSAIFQIFAKFIDISHLPVASHFVVWAERCYLSFRTTPCVDNCHFERSTQCVVEKSIFNLKLHGEQNAEIVQRRI